MNKKIFIFGAIAIVILGVIFFFIFNKPSSHEGGPECSAPEKEWIPQKGECPGTTTEMQNKCNEFCLKYPDCCGGEKISGGGPGQTLLPLPSDTEINSLIRNYVTTIKAIDEGPLIYSTSGPQEIISDNTLEKMKATGFNTVQVLIIGKWEGNKIIFNEVNNRVLLNDIIAIKKKGMAVWVAFDSGGGNPSSANLGESYEAYKMAYMNFVNISSELLEKYKVEYITVNNELDMFFNLQTQWGDKNKINDYLIDIYPSTIEVARKNFKGKVINKMTTPDTGTGEFIAATFENVDIAGVDVGPYIGDNFNMQIYKEGLQKFQTYATKASEAGIPWMNAEYWISNFGETTMAQKQHQFECTSATIDAYSKSIPNGVGFTYNEFATFSFQPDGEKTRLAMKEFLENI